MNLRRISEFLTTDQPVARCDLMFVVAGTMDRKVYGLELFQRQLAPRIILSVARYEVRPTAAILSTGAELLKLRDQTPPPERHFWIDMDGAKTTIRRAAMKDTGTFPELQAFAKYIAPQAAASIALISTSIHLRRIRYCCSKIPELAHRPISLWAVPESRNSFQSGTLWKRRSDSSYVLSECVKLLAYMLMYRRS